MNLITFVLASLAIAGSPASYEVPVPAELAPFASFQLNDFLVEERSGELKISYKVPVELTGIENYVSFQGPLGRGPVRLIGDQGEMLCELERAENACQVTYWPLRQDLGLLSRLFKGLPGPEREARMAVAARFSGDWEGVIRFPVGK
jgi:hypothetical protein